MGITCRDRAPGIRQQGWWALPCSRCGKQLVPLPPVVFILAMQSEGQRKSPKEWLVAGSKLLPWTAL